jgi:hypothetical protein
MPSRSTCLELCSVHGPIIYGRVIVATGILLYFFVCFVEIRFSRRFGLEIYQSRKKITRTECFTEPANLDAQVSEGNSSLLVGSAFKQERESDALGDTLSV